MLAFEGWDNSNLVQSVKQKFGKNNRKVEKTS
jgi:hypothetical protein